MRIMIEMSASLHSRFLLRVSTLLDSYCHTMHCYSVFDSPACMRAFNSENCDLCIFGSVATAIFVGGVIERFSNTTITGNDMHNSGRPAQQARRGVRQQK